jgi:hypothetical protein
MVSLLATCGFLYAMPLAQSTESFESVSREELLLPRAFPQTSNAISEAHVRSG